MRNQYIVILTALLVTFFCSDARAACSNPTGAEGAMVYNSDYKTVQFCNGTEWIDTGASGGGASILNAGDCADGDKMYYNGATNSLSCGVYSGTDAHWGNVKLLLHFDGDNNSTTFTDSAKGYGFAVNGNAVISTSKSKYGGASGYFDGTGDYLATGDDADWTLSSGDWTIETWVNLSTLSNGASNYQCFIGQYQDDSNRWNMCYSGTDDWLYIAAVTGGTTTGTHLTSSDQNIVAGQWYHLAAVRSGTTVTMYVNGVAVGTSTMSLGDLSASLNIGKNSYSGGDFAMKGYLDELRITKGTARYIADFTPPTTSFPNGAKGGTTANGSGSTSTDSYWSSVVLLQSFDTNLSDTSSRAHTATANDNAAVSSAQKKFGAGSLSLDGTNDNVTIPDSDDWDFASGDFTVETFVRFNQLPASGGFYGIVAQILDGQNGWSGYIYNNSGTMELRFFYRTGMVGTAVVRTISVSANTWYHFAWSRSGNTLYLFQNGVMLGAGESMTTAIQNVTNNLEIGSHNGGLNYLNGYIDELRITKGVARYTSDFNIPTAAFPTQ